MSIIRLFLLIVAIAVALTSCGTFAAEPKADRPAAKAPALPEVGKQAPDFALEAVTGETVKLAKLVEKTPVVLVVLRGYPGYQCPICNRQVGELLKSADPLKKAGAQVVLVYPGPSGELKERAKEFIADRTIPEHFRFLIDPDYTFTNAYGLRWEAPRETAYPSTFVIDRKGIVRFAHTSKSHGDRTDPKTILKALAELQEQGSR